MGNCGCSADWTFQHVLTLWQAFSNFQHSGSGVGRISLGGLEAVVEMASGSGLDGCLCTVHL